METNKYFHEVNGYGDEVIYYNGKSYYPQAKKLSIIQRLIRKFISYDCEVPF